MRDFDCTYIPDLTEQYPEGFGMPETKDPWDGFNLEGVDMYLSSNPETRKLLHDIYREMNDAIPELEKAITEYYETRGYVVYTVFLSVSNEANREYFCDIEVGGSPEKYKRIYGRKTQKTLVDHYIKNN